MGRKPQMLTAAMIGLLVLAIAALAVHDEGGNVTRVATSPSPARAEDSEARPDIDVPADETTTSLLDETTSVPTTVVAAAPRTTVPRALTTTPPQATTAWKPSRQPPTSTYPTTTSTSRPCPVPGGGCLPTSNGPTMSVEPGSGVRAYTVNGSSCTGANAAGGVVLYASGQAVAGGDAQATPNGTWSIPVSVPTSAPAGVITVTAYCFDEGANVKYFDYYPQSVTVT